MNKKCCYCKKNKDTSLFTTKKNGELMSRCNDCYIKEKEKKKVRKENNTNQLRPPSNEQKLVLKYVKKNNNVIVKAVAGAGKTTTILHIGQDNIEQKVCVITYSSRLKTETKEKIEQFNINNIDIFSYHSYCKRYYNNNEGLLGDKEIIEILKEDTEKINLKSYDIIIIDECQDMSPLYYMIVKKIINDNYEYDMFEEDEMVTVPQIVILGDKRQSIFQYNGSDARYLEKDFLKKLFKNEYIWKELHLSKSFRVPIPVTNFINNCLFDEEVILSDKVSDFKPRYLICQPFSEYCDDILNEVLYYLNLGFKNHEIFILAPSIKKGTNSPISSLSKRFSKLFAQDDLRFNQHIPNDDEAKLTDEVIKDKLVISTFHQAKGLERPVIIIFNFDESYYKYYKPDLDPTTCPNELYVAVTRTLTRISLIHNYEFNYLPFIKKENIHKYCDIINKKTLSIKNKNNNKDTYDVTELNKYLPINLVTQIHNVLYKITKVNENSSKKIKLKGVSKQQYGSESVSDITGTAIPLYYAISKFGKKLNKTNIKLTENNYNREILEIANIMMCERDYIDYKIVQIQAYDWLSKYNLNICINRLDNINLVENGYFEKPLTIEPREETYYKYIKGSIDYQDDKKVIEFKCVEELEPAHFIQLAIYKYINEIHNKVYNYYLYNIFNDELYELKSNHEDLKKMIKLLVSNKCFPIKKSNNKEFMDKCLEYNFKNYI